MRVDGRRQLDVLHDPGRELGFENHGYLDALPALSFFLVSVVNLRRIPVDVDGELEDVGFPAVGRSFDHRVLARLDLRNEDHRGHPDALLAPGLPADAELAAVQQFPEHEGDVFREDARPVVPYSEFIPLEPALVVQALQVYPDLREDACRFARV